MKRIVNKKQVIAFSIGILVASLSVSAAAITTGTSISYDNKTSGLSSTNIQSALDELSTKTELKNRNKIVSAYAYNSSTCVTGEEDTCVKTDCYKNMTANSCKAGDIIKYKVNDTDIVTFHVMYDNGTTLTMQSQKNTINNTMWISAADYASTNTDGTSCSYTSCNDEGPLTALIALERATAGWTNVNNQTYTMGTTTFKTNAFTECGSYDSCVTNKYTLPSRTSKARMITLQEAADIGCTSSNQTCPKWMYNYLKNSTSYGGTVSDSASDLATGSYNYGYWTMSARSSYTNVVWRVSFAGSVGSDSSYITSVGARAVVEINKT